MKTLEVSRMSIQFGGLQVLREVSFSVSPGELVALIGPNGAGKTTVLNCISGILRCTGNILLAGKPILGKRPSELVALGIARTFQHAELVAELTVRENLLAARHTSMRTNVIAEILNLPSAVKEQQRHTREIDGILASVGLQDTRDRLVSDLPFGVQKVIGFARALAITPRLLLLDEPSAGLTGAERQDMARFIREVRRRFEVSIVWIEHDMQMVGDLADTAVVLDYGRTLAVGPPEVVLSKPEVVQAYLGAGLKLKKRMEVINAPEDKYHSLAL